MYAFQRTGSVNAPDHRISNTAIDSVHGLKILSNLECGKTTGSRRTYPRKRNIRRDLQDKDNVRLGVKRPLSRENGFLVRAASTLVCNGRMHVPITYDCAPFCQSRQYDSFHMIAAVLGEKPRFFFR
jgi:hypothetical protein